MDTSAFWEGFEHEQKSELRSGRIATEVTQSPQQQPTGQEALIRRLQLKASKGDDDALATLRMLESINARTIQWREADANECFSASGSESL